MEKSELNGNKMSADNAIREILEKTPIKISPWKVAQFFENEKNISEEYLDKSLDKLAEILPDFETKNRLMIEELEKITLLAVPMFRKLPLMTILTVIREAANSSQVFTFLPDFPQQPASNLLSHIFPDDSMSSEQKKNEYEEIAKSTKAVFEYLVSWRNEVAKYVKGLEKFIKENNQELSEEQKEHVDVLLERSKETKILIDGKIEQKTLEKEQEEAEFKKFFRVLRREPKYFKMSDTVAREQIHQVYVTSDRDLRRIVADTAPDIQDDVRLTRNSKRKANDGDSDGNRDGKIPRTVLIETRLEKPIKNT